MPVRLVHDSDESSAATYGLVSSYSLDVEPLQGRKHLVSRQVIWGGGGCGVFIEHILRESGRKMSLTS